MAKFSLSNRGNSLSIKIKIVDNNRTPVKRNNLLNDVQETDAMNVGEIDTPTQITADIDPNIIPENIKDGVKILGVTGNYTSGNFVPNYISFYNYQGTSLTDEIAKIDTSNITSMTYMFSYCTKVTELNLSSFNTSNVTVMNNMFENCEDMTELNLSSFDTSNVTNMATMFSGDRNLEKLDLSSFDTRKVSSMVSILKNVIALKEIKFGANWISPSTGTYSNITTGTWTNTQTGVSYTGLQALLVAGRTLGAIEGTWIRS